MDKKAPEQLGLKASNCPACGYKHDAATAAFGPPSPPKPGDFSVCFQCATLLVFDDELEAVLALPADLEGIPPGDARTTHALT